MSPVTTRPEVRPRTGRISSSRCTSADAARSEFHWVFHAAMRKDGSAVTTRGVETQIYRKEAEKWRLVHVHYSEDRLFPEHRAARSRARRHSRSSPRRECGPAAPGAGRSTEICD